MKPRLTKILKSGGLLCAGLLLLFSLAYLDRAPVDIQSLESKTRAGGPVFNRIRWESRGTKDIWLMQQSHDGADMDPSLRDRLAIVVDKSRFPKTARFYQLEPGELEWSENSKPAAHRAACFTCHTNGPRAIRPDGQSSLASLSFWQRGKLSAWNIRIKTYGRIVAHRIHEPKSLGATVVSANDVPFRYPGVFENQPLKVKTCIFCHNEKPWGRGLLTRQNAVTIRFMVDSGFMPPKGFSLSEWERAQINAFIGF